VGAVRVLDGHVERGRDGSWTSAREDFRIGPGEALRTGRDSLALLTLPWMQILVGGDAVLALPPKRVLSASLERGRIQERASTEILKVSTEEAVVRGRGTVVVSRGAATPLLTRVSSLEGVFRVKAGRHTISLAAGQGAVVAKGAAPEIVPLPEPPRGLSPGTDPVYVEKGRAVRLAWTGATRRYHLELTSLDGGEVVLARDVEGLQAELPTRWLGTFRWRVSAVDDAGLEGSPSEPGLLCVVEK